MAAVSTALQVAVLASTAAPVVSRASVSTPLQPVQRLGSVGHFASSSLRAKCRPAVEGRGARVTCGVNITTSFTTSVDPEQVKPQGDRVLVRLEAVDATTPGGLLLPGSAAKYAHYMTGEVIAVGTETTNITKGQKVLFSDVNAYEVNLGAESDRLCFLKADDLLAIVA